MEKIVEVKNVYFSYEDALVLEDINFNIYKGDYIGIVGPNGSSKSTLIKIMLNMLKPNSGNIELFGQPIKIFKDWRKVGYVPQKATSFNTSFPATVEEVVAANLFSNIGLFKSISKSQRQKVRESLEIVGMKDFSSRLIGNLSGGQQQKVFIARALVSSPEIIFLDEPTVGIDSKSQEEFYQLLDKLNTDKNITIVMISHDIGVITEKASRVACMGNRKLIEHSPCSSVPFEKILANLYGDRAKALVHLH